MVGAAVTGKSRYSESELSRLASLIDSSAPELIGISVVELTRDKSLQLLTRLRACTSALLVVGGVDATFAPEVYVDAADIIVRGEGEFALGEIVTTLASRSVGTFAIPDDFSTIANVGFSFQGRLQLNRLSPLERDLDQFPLPGPDDDARLWRLERQSRMVPTPAAARARGKRSDGPRQEFVLTASRGCAYSCTYCVNSSLKELMGGRAFVRRYSTDTVIRAAAAAAETGRIRKVFFFDDDFFLRPVVEIVDFAERWSKEVRLPFFVMGSPGTIRADKLDPLLDAGLHSLNVGIQTGSQRIARDIYQRSVSSVAIRDLAALLHQRIGRGRYPFLPPVYDFIISNPYETKNDILQSIRLIQELPKPFRILVHSLTFFEGCRLSEKAMRDGVVSLPDTSSQINYHDTVRQIAARGHEVYLNSILYWMDGLAAEGRYGILPEWLLEQLTSDGWIRRFSKHEGFINMANSVIPTRRRLAFLRSG